MHIKNVNDNSALSCLIHSYNRSIYHEIFLIMFCMYAMFILYNVYFVGLVHAVCQNDTMSCLCITKGCICVMFVLHHG